MIAEEMGEAIKAIGKVLRHSYESKHPDGGPTYRESLDKELGDVRHVMIRLCHAGDLHKIAIHDRADAKAVIVGPYLHHQTEE
ncbi:hypothetical protein EP7_002346 [Isosphaeraceae bacterium EP7]